MPNIICRNYRLTASNVRTCQFLELEVPEVIHLAAARAA